MTLNKRVGTLAARLLCGLFLATAVVGCTSESDSEELRGLGSEDGGEDGGDDGDAPCTPDDCVPLAPLGGSDCPEGTEPTTTAECVDNGGECVWEFTDECVPSGGGGEDPPPPPPPPNDPKPPAPADGTPPRPVAPPNHG